MNPKNTTRTLSLPRLGAVGIVFLLLMAGQGSSQTPSPEDVGGEALRDQVLEILAAYGVEVPPEAEKLLNPAALDSLASYLQDQVGQQPGVPDASGIANLLEKAFNDVPVLVDYLTDHPEVEEGLQEAIDLVRDGWSQPSAACVMLPSGILVLDLLMPAMCLVAFLLIPVFIVLVVVLIAVSIVYPIAYPLAYSVMMQTTFQLDEDGNGLGDDWDAYWRAIYGVISPVFDTDSDYLFNTDEFRWELLPVCLPSLPDNLDTQLVDESLLPSENCMDFDADNWWDGPEVKYWNNPENDVLLYGGEVKDTDVEFNEVREAGIAIFDPDRLMDLDDDTLRNTYDPDSDGDGLLDGDEIVYGSYPEFRDSDCDATVPACTPSWDTSYHDTSRVGKPGTGDGISDKEELTYWKTLSSSAWSTDYDGDGIESNLLDPDADGDTLLDSEEITVHLTKPYHIDSDLDGLRDDAEVRIHATNPNHWDTDGDGMPDAWEVENHMNPRVNDANQDADNDGLRNVLEYRYARPGTWNEATQGAWTGGTNPIDPDTEGDGLFDGPEVLTHRTDPFWWDTDSDGLPDAWEAQYSLQPLSNDANQDADSDFFDQGNDGTIEQSWTNIQEYEYSKPAGWNEELTGPWPGGTDPRNPDTDGDAAKDGQEIYFGTDPRISNTADPDEVAGDAQEWINDDDLDGLNWTEEALLGTNPNDPDTDGDGLCDGGRAENCYWPGGDGTRFQPGEHDYGSTPWSLDSDADGLDDDDEAIRWDPGRSGDAVDSDGDLLNGVIDADNDDDSLLDGDEVDRGTNPALRDTDNDGLNDGEEVHVYNTNPSLPDHDGDGLRDGNEVHEFHTRPLNPDTDDDGLNDGAEILTHGTDALLWDTDLDGVPDGWEVSKGTQPRTRDEALDPDGDGLSNRYEYEVGSHPTNADSDTDGLPDGWEDRHATGVLSWSRISNPDADGATNIQEFQAGTDPRNPDTDGDGLWDGGELSAGSNPLVQDTDLDGLLDGDEVDMHGTDPTSRDPDGEGLDDFDEIKAGTDPFDPDSDNDGLSDYDEVFGFQGKYDPNNSDTNGDGYTDGQNEALEGCPTCDTDNDGLSNTQEVNDYNTEPFIADTDCDGIEDGPEATFWNGYYSLTTFKPYLRNADVDGDGIRDGIEVGPTGTGSHVLYRTAPDLVDTDGDGLRDDVEARNNFKPDCAQQPASSASWGLQGLGSGSPLLSPPGTEENPLVGHAGSPLPVPVSGAPLASVATDAGLLAGLVQGSLYEDDASGLLYGVDGNGLFVQGGYGVRLYVDLEALPDLGDVSVDLADVLGPQAMGHESGVPCTNPLLEDTDGDGLTDPEERSGTKNPYKSQRHDASRPGGNTDPCAADTDGDQVQDGLEVGIKRNRDGFLDAWVMNPNRIDTDGDGKDDGVEDAGQDGVNDLAYDSLSGVYTAKDGGAAVSSPVDADTDDDGLPDGLIGGLRDPEPLNWDLDGDGLSDGLESGVTKPVVVDGVQYTLTAKSVWGLADWYTYQEFQGSVVGGVALTTPVDDPDKDDDGLLDGLEDWNHNGKWEDIASIGKELNPDSSDSDGDGLGDGREILVFIRSQTQRPTVSFGELFTSKGFTEAELVYDGGNKWETNPRVPDSDGDGVFDGKDMNPRLESNFIGLTLSGFEFLDKAIDCCGASDIEMFVAPLTVTMPFGGATYQVSMGAGSSVDVSPSKGSLPDKLIEKVSDPANLAAEPVDELYGLDYSTAPWKIKRITGEPVVRFQLPEGIDTVNPTDMKVTISIQLNDEDAFDNHDTLDINPAQGEGGKAGVVTIDLAADTVGTYKASYGLDYFDSKQVVKSMVGSRVKSAKSNDARLDVEVGDTIPKHFINGLIVTKAGGVAHLNEAAGAGGRDYLGTQGDLEP